MDSANDALEENQDRPTEVVSHHAPPITTVSKAARENRPDVLTLLIEEGKSVRGNDNCGWTALHHAAFLGHIECLKILLNEETCDIDDRAFDGTTPLMAACANLPTSKDCIKVLCEYKADQEVTNDSGMTALQVAILRKPDLKVVKWLVRSGAGVNDKKSMVYLLERESGGREIFLPHQYYFEEEHMENDEAEIADIAIYLAKHGFMKKSLRYILLFNDKIAKSYQLLETIVMEHFLDNGAILSTKRDAKLMPHINIGLFSPAALSLFAQKSIIFLEGLLQRSIDFERYNWQEEVTIRLNVVTILVIKGQAGGTVPLSVVQEAHDGLQSTISRRGIDLPPDLRALEKLYAMSQNPPSLSHMARTTVRTQIAKCGKFCSASLKKLPLPETLKDFVQLSDLGDASLLHDLNKGFDECYELYKTLRINRN